MNTIPQAKDPDPRNKLYLQLVGIQLQGKNEGEIADYFKRGSAQEVFKELKGYGFPICEVCGANPVVGSHCPKRKPRSPSVQGEAQELPPFKDAATSFRDTIRTLEHYLDHMLTHKETLRGDYFVGEGETEESNTREVRGAQWHPHPYEVVLIAASILEHDGQWGYVERLLNLLHLKPTDANRQKLYRYIHGRNVDENGRPERGKDGRWKDEADGLLYRAKQIAALIRGANEVRTGPKAAPITSVDQYEAWRIRRLIERGFSQKEIEKREREDFDDWKSKTRESVLKELEAAKQTLSENEFTDESRGAHEALRELSEETFDGDSFIRRYKLARESE